MKKRIITILLCLTMILASLPDFAVTTNAAAAATSGSCGSNLTWRYSNGTLTITGKGRMNDYKGTRSAVNEAPWADNYQNITQLSLSNDITYIGAYAFYGLSKVTSVTIPQKTTEIGSGAFDYCSQLSSVNFPDGLKTIGRFAFADTRIKNVVIPESVTTVGVAAFKGSSGYTVPQITITSIPESITQVGDSAFSGCNILDDKIPANWSSIPDYCFSSSAFNNLEIPEGVTSIGTGAFYFCTTNSIHIPEGVTTIGENAFSYCRINYSTGEEVASIYVPNTVTSWRNALSSMYPKKLYFGGSKNEWKALLADSNNTFSSTEIFCVGYSLADTALEVEKGGEHDLPDIIPSAGSDADQFSPVWTSSDSNVISINESAGTFSALATGRAVLTCDIKGCRRQCAVEVTVEPESIEFSEHSVNAILYRPVTIPEYTLVPSDIAPSQIEWSSSDESVAVFDTAGNLNTRAVGRTTITATLRKSGGTIISDSFELVVKDGIMVSFNSGSAAAEGQMDPIFLEYGVDQALPANVFTWNGYKFDKWSATVERKYYEFADEETVNITAAQMPYDVTFTAEWTNEVYDITYVLDGGTNNIQNPDTYCYGARISFKDPEKDGYIFGGWYLDEAFESKITDIASSDTGNKTLFAKWLKNYVDGISLDEDEISLHPGDTRQLTATVEPEDTQADRTVTWKSSDTSVADVSGDGTVIAIGGGEAVITATTKTGGLSARCTVKVFVPLQSLSISPDTVTIGRGGTYELSCILNPDDANEGTEFTWSSADPSIATVDQNGKVTAVKAGETVIRVDNGAGISAECAVEVNVPVTGISLDKTSAEMLRGERLQLSADILPEDATDPEVTWMSSDKSVAKVDASGVVTAISKGSATLTAYSQDDPTKRAVCTVTVNNKARQNPSPANAANVNKLLTAITRKGTYSNGTYSISMTNQGYKYTITYRPQANEIGFAADFGSNIGQILMTYKIDELYVYKDNISFNIQAYTQKLGTVFIYADAYIDMPEYVLDDELVFMANETRSNYMYSWNYTGESFEAIYGNGDETVLNTNANLLAAAALAGWNYLLTKECVYNLVDLGFVNFNKDQIIDVTDVAINESDTTLKAGATCSFTAEVSPSNATDQGITWSSSNTSVATVDGNGKVTAKAAGTCTITAVSSADSSIYDSRKVTVTAATVAVSRVSVSRTSATLTAGDTLSLSATVQPENASNKNVSWSSSNTSVATVNSSGKVTAKAAGSARITVTTSDGGKTASCSITVKAKTSGSSGSSAATQPSITTKTDTVQSGKCGANLTYTIDSDGVLTISGTGKMTNFNISSMESPFFGNKKITKVIIKEGVTSIGSYAFTYCSNMESVSIPSTVTSIGDSAFQNCAYLEKVTLPEGITTTGFGAFSDSGVTTVSLPKSLKVLGLYLFDNCPLESVKYAGTKADWDKIEKSNLSADKKWYSMVQFASSSSSSSGSSGSARFPDVADPSKAYYKPVYWAVDNGVVQGYKNGNFGPQDSCTRAQFVTILWRMAGRPAAKATAGFRDVSSSMSSYRAINWAVGEGIIMGYKEDNTFRPDNPVTRGQLVTMLWRWLGRPAAKATSGFRDVNSSMSAYKAIMWASGEGIVKGSNGAFNPTGNCLRQQIVTIFYRCVREGTLDTKINKSLIGTVK